MKKIFGVILVAACGLWAVDKISMPTDFSSVGTGSRANLKANFTETENKVNLFIDTQNVVNDTVRYYLNGSGGITGTGQLVRSASPTLTGTANVANMVFSGTLTTSALTASQALFTNGSKQLVSNAITGSGNVVMSESPTFSGTVTNGGTISGGTVNATTLQQDGVQTVTTTGTQTLTNKSIVASQITTGTFGAGDYDFPGALQTVGNIKSNSGKITSYNNGGQGTYIEIAKNEGSLPGYPSSYYPVLKTDFTNINFVANDKWLGLFQATSGTSSNQMDVMSYSGSDIDVSLKTDGQSSYIRTGKLGIATDSPDSTLTVTGSGNFSGNVRVGGNLNVTGTVIGTLGSGLTIDAPSLTGATSIASDASGFYETGSFTATWTGFTTALTSTVYYTRVGRLVTFNLEPFSGTSNSANFLSDACIPAALRPKTGVTNCKVANRQRWNSDTG
jgi:cytoskeletal protein CcmA (bactofilin family)